MVQSIALSTNMIQRSISANSNNSSTTIENDTIAFQEIPLSALSKRSLRKLSNLLNSKKILRSEEGYERDWRGLASLSKQKYLCDENTVNSDDPTTKVIQLWCTNNPKTATFAYLEQFLGVIDRWDVSDDIYENLVEDKKTYQNKLQHASSENIVDVSSVNTYADFGHGSDPNILTKSDVLRAQKGLPPQMYDAFVLYADADLNYASEMLTKLEDDPQYNLKLCMKDRDLLAGVQFEHIALTQLIEERCKHLIVILTQEFLKSPENSFLVNYTQALQIQHKTRKIVPLLYEENVDVPRTLRMYTHLRYNRVPTSLFNFWSKLAESIQIVNGVLANTTIPITYYRKDCNTSSTSNRQTSNFLIDQINNFPNSPTEIPSITIIPPDEGNKAIEKKIKINSLTIRTSKNNNDNKVLRSAHSTGQLHTAYQTKNTISMSDLSTTSIYNDNKKKKKWPSKILKKVFNRGGSKKSQEI